METPENASLANLKVILLILVFVLKGAQAQETRIDFEHISKVDDISFGKINDIIQDSEGYLWLADETNRCVYRYDGSVITRFDYDPEDSYSLAGYYPETLAKGKNGVVWIGFNNDGLARYDPKTEQFTHFTHDAGDPESIISNDVSVILVDRAGRVWVGTRLGLDRYDPDSGKFTHFQHDPSDPASLSHNIVRSIYEDREGTIWVGTGVFWTPDSLGGLNRFEADSQSFTRFLHDPEDPGSLISNKIRAIAEDSNGNFWVGTRENGLHLMDRQSGTFERIGYSPDQDGKLYMPAAGGPMGHITFIEEDREGYLWIGTFDTGLIRWDPKLKARQHYGSTGSYGGDYDENTSWAFFVSDNGMLWLASQKDALYKADPGIPRIREVSAPFKLKTVIEQGSEKLWLGTFENGLLLKNRNSDTYQRFAHSASNPTSLSDNRVQKLYVDKQNTLWVGTLSGLNRLNPDGESFRRYESFTTLTGPIVPYITDIYEDHAARLWVGTQKGLFRLDRKTDSLHYLPLDPGTDIHVQKILENESRDLFVGGGKSLFKYLPGSDQFQLALEIDSPAPFDWYIDKENIVWTAGSIGLWVSDQTWDTITPHRLQSGGYIGQESYTIAADASDNLWLGTKTGIVKLAANRENSIFFGQKNDVLIDALPDLTESFLGSSGLMYFAGSPNGYYFLDPDQFDNPVEAVRLQARELHVNNERVIPSEGAPVTSSLMASDAVHLDYSENSFSLQFSAIQFRSDLKKRIWYRLEGYEEFWREALSGQRINYTKIPPGTYNLIYRSPYNNSDQWAEESLVFRIASPWWQTSWAYSGYALLLFVGIFYFYKYQKRRIIIRERNLAKEKELAQAREIRKAYDKLEVAHKNLKSTQTQLIHSEKMASLGELTAGIAHEIQNPLNFVNNFSEVSREMLQELLEEMKKGDVEEAEAIAQDIVQNLDKINHHGNRAGNIVKGMLQHSRGSEGIKEPTDLNQLAYEYIRLAYHGIRARDKEFHVDLETKFDDAVGEVAVVPQDIGRVLLNLLTNAFHAVRERRQKETGSYQPALRIRTNRTPNGVELSVWDNGVGIPEKIRDKIFQPFFTTKPTGEGTGLGLSMSYDIVTKGHGGTLSYNVRENEGTEFIVKLPV